MLNDLQVVEYPGIRWISGQDFVCGTGSRLHLSFQNHASRRPDTGASGQLRTVPSLSEDQGVKVMAPRSWTCGTVGRVVYILCVDGPFDGQCNAT